MTNEWWMVKGRALDSLLVERTIRTLVSAENLEKAIEKALKEPIPTTQLQVTPHDWGSDDV